MQNINGQYRNEMYKRAENMIPQLDVTFNVSDNSDSDLHSYLDLAGAIDSQKQHMHTSRKDRSIIIDTMTEQDIIYPQTYYLR